MCGHHVDLKQRDKNTHLGYVSYFCTSTFFLIHLPKIWLWDTQCVVYTDPTSLTYRHISFIHETCTLKCKPKQVLCSMSKYLLVELPYDRVAFL